MNKLQLALAVSLTLAAASPFAEQTQTGGNWVYNTKADGASSGYLRAYGSYSRIVDTYQNMITKYGHYSWFSKYRPRLEKALEMYIKRRDYYKSRLSALTWTKKMVTTFTDINKVEGLPILLSSKEENFDKAGYNWSKVTNTYSVSTTTTTKVWEEHVVYYSNGTTNKTTRNATENTSVLTRQEVKYLTTKLSQIIGSTVSENEAHRQGFSGAGVTIAVLDTGLTGGTGIRLNTSYDFKNHKIVYDTSDNVDDGNGHGTHVTGIAKSLAYNSDILSVKVCNDRGSCNPNDVLKGLEYSADNGAKVVNISIAGMDFSNYTKSKSVTLPTLAKLNANGSFVSVAAGNKGYSCKDTHYMDKYQYLGVICSWPAALPAHEELKEYFNGDLGWVAVGAVDENNEMPYWSNRAGIMKEFYLVAPGVNIESDWLDGSTKSLSGTSMAAPHVAGTAALLFEKYPYLKGKSIQDIILWTADDLGEVGIDEIFGHGLLNVDKAFLEGDDLLVNGVPAKNYKAGTITASGAFGGTLSGIAGLSSVSLEGYNGSYEGDYTPTVVSVVDDFTFGKFEEVAVGNTIVGFTRDENNVVSNPMLGYKMGNTSVKLTMDDSLVGAEASFLKDVNSTYINLSYNEGMLSMDATYGRGTASLTDDTLISDISSVGAFGANVTYGKDFWVGAAKPLSIVSGSINAFGQSHSLSNSQKTVFKVGYNTTTDEVELSSYLDSSGEKSISLAYKF